MKRLLLLVSIFAGFALHTSLTANQFPKCNAACDKYYQCATQAHPNATDEQKDMLKKGCELNCNKAKYYPSIASCFDKGGNSCQTYWSCISSAMQK